ncbi:putative methylmalonyl-CoA mutase small subunit [Mycolicibacterium chitae]|uniref:Methylmalonyl-CoA mutase small subunit n=1 Tax=Mycolicibacterium chitae TaxID=1792 RepID=A0A3S4VIC7_MYCCI|nr:methylmalonyl-CoA mutase small subunit [Mycolicibacterium chitae]MCV7105813.1 methylmalonyl-CoA mutase small subunit [Mycolicibacterium chitae]BBZ04658.1 putative methylmalonyl-CoA mutase small subunit [Mycolicibacterium chitae]VEG48288.1 methylmalonyl-CoA mutase, heterodimeric type, beta chain [Mycolicibacterium chitae]
MSSGASVVSADRAELEQARARWRDAVAGVLAKSTRRDVSELPDEPERLLDSPTYEGFDVRPLYTALDALPEPPLPGQWPFLRGGDATRDVLSGWKVAESFPAPGAAVADANATLLAALSEGVSALVLRVGAEGVPTGDLDRLLEGVFVELVPVVLAAGADYVAAADVLLGLVSGLAEEQRATLSVDLGGDPLTAALSAVPSASVDDVVAMAKRVTEFGGAVRAITVDGPALHNRGANGAWELAGVIAAAVNYLRLLVAAGVDTADALRQISFRLAADDDQFMTTAKMRAVRQLWARVAEVLGAPDAGAVQVHAVSSLAMMAQRDPWVNMLRCTLAAFGAGVGGADTVEVNPFDVAIAGGAPGVSRSFSRRIARNTQLLLLEESHLGRVRDPGGGSWFLEDLTQQLAEQAWRNFQAIEARGGFAAATEFIAEQVEAVAAARRADIAHRRTAVTGVNEFPNLAEVPLPQQDSPEGVLRYAQDFEALRNRSDDYLAANGKRPQVLLVPLGPLAEHNIRTTFATNLLASGGIEAINPGPVDSATVAAAVAEAGSSAAVVICGTDARYADEASGVVEALRGAGVDRVYLAGPDKAVAAAEHRPDEYLTAKIDAVEALSTLLTRLGA